jgi:uncharacterized membrane protein
MLSSVDWLVVLSALGFVISVYAIWVDNRIHTLVRYKPACDVTKVVSCSRVFGSNYGQVFGFSNAYIGLIGYALIFVFASLNNIPYVNVLAFFAVAVSLVLAYVSYFKLKSFCLVCTATYVINIFLLFISCKWIG